MIDAGSVLGWSAARCSRPVAVTGYLRRLIFQTRHCGGSKSERVNETVGKANVSQTLQH